MRSCWTRRGSDSLAHTRIDFRKQIKIDLSSVQKQIKIDASIFQKQIKTDLSSVQKQIKNDEFKVHVRLLSMHERF
jgi:hypothetical protein